MQISNKGFFLFFRYLVVVLLLVAVADYFLAGIRGSVGQIFEQHYPAYFSLGLVLLLSLLQLNYFCYQDDYEIIVIRNKSLLFGAFTAQSGRYEFPKAILKDYKLTNRPWRKKLVLHLDTSSGQTKVRKFNLFFVSSSKIERMRKSLHEVCERNARLDAKDSPIIDPKA